MVLDKLGESLKGTLAKIAKSMFVSDKLINELVKDIQRALLQSDVNVKLVFNLTNQIKERVKSEDTPKGISKKEHLINIVYEELVVFLGKEKLELKVTKGKEPIRIMLVGLFGAGKTTTAGKLAKYYTNRGFKTALVGLDVHRPAAMDQLEQIGKQINVPVFIKKGEKDALKIWKEHEPELQKFDLLIIDTAGRDALSDDLIKEIEEVNKKIKPQERLLVISADLGQAAQTQAEQFHKSCNITGIIATKMDGTAKAGGALSACAVTDAPIIFIGVGEKSEDLEPFNPKGFVGRLLGMGDLEALLDKAQGAMDEDEAKDLGKRFLKGDFNLIDLYEQMEAMNKMGPLNKLLDMVPGMNQAKIPKDMLKVQEGKLKKWKFMMGSFTKKELEDPDLVDRARAERIAKGSGTSAGEIRELVKQYRQSKKMMKMFKGKDPEKMMKKMGQKGMPGMPKFK